MFYDAMTVDTVSLASKSKLQIEIFQIFMTVAISLLTSDAVLHMLKLKTPFKLT
jgi:hypothetical protein